MGKKLCPADIINARDISNLYDINDAFMGAMYYGIFKDLENQSKNMNDNYIFVLGRHLYIYIKHYHRDFLFEHKYILNTMYNIKEEYKINDNDFLIIKEI